jgi:hypothetical protein
MVNICRAELNLMIFEFTVQGDFEDDVRHAHTAPAAGDEEGIVVLFPVT